VEFPEELRMPTGMAVKAKKKKKSVLKNIRQTERRTAINRSNKTVVGNAMKKLRALIAAGNLDEAKRLLPQTHSILDRAIQQSVLYENTANRYKARLARAINAAQAAAAKSA
jgi:small subunit ribosomal protein S20